MSSGHVVTPALCSHCGAFLDRAGLARDLALPPKPGDLSLCIVCAGVMVFDADMRPRAPEPGEVERAYAAHPGLRTEIVRCQLAIRCVKTPPRGGGRAREHRQ